MIMNECLSKLHDDCHYEDLPLLFQSQTILFSIKGEG